MSTPYIGLVKAEYDYAATNEEELDISEEQLLYVLEDDDADWWKVRTKQSPSAGTSASEAPAGLVPASYVTPVAPVKQVTAMYDYTATAEEEISITEDTTYDFYEDDGEWALVGSRSAKQVGYAPSTYFDLEGSADAGNAGSSSAAPAAAAIPAPPPPPPAPPAPAAPPAPVAAAGGGFKLPPPPRRMGGDSSDDSDDDEQEPPRAPPAPAAPAAAFIPPPPPPPPAPPMPAVVSPPPAAPAAPRPPVMAPVPVAASGKKAIAAYDFTAAGSDEISMVEGETVYVIDDSQDDWWKIRNERGEEGEVPATYVELEGGASASSAAAGEADDDEAYARKAADEEKEERRKDRERKRLRALEDEARGFALPAMQPPPRRKDSPATATAPSPAPRSAVSPPPPAPIPVPPPAPEAGVRSPSPPPMSPAMREAADKQRDGRSERDERRERHRQRERERDKQRERERDYDRDRSDDRDRNGHAPPIEKTKPSRERTRIWKDRTGAFKVEAEFVGLSGPNNEKIRLHKTNGVVIEVPVDKMSPEDLKLLEHMTRRRLGPRRDDDRDRRRDRGDDRRDRSDDRRDRDRGDERRSDRDRDDRGKARPPSETVRDRSKAAPQGKKSQTDWFEWFLNAGCDVDDCSRYANNFEKDRIDEAILPDLESGTLRSLGLREGDIIRVSKHIKSKYGSTAAGPGASASKSSDAPQPPRKEVRIEKEDQMDDDEELARKLQEELNAGRDGSGLFTTKEGGVKNTRRGRPTPKSASSNERASTPDPVRRVSPDTIREASNRSSSTQPVASGFDDDAWTVKPASKPATPALVDVSPTPAMPATSNQASNAQALTDAYLESMGLGKNSRPSVAAAPARQAAASPAPPAPQPPQQQPQQQYAQDNQLAPQQTGYYAPSSGPRAPPIPIPINQQLLNPLVPTQTGLTGYIPTRNQASPMQGMMPQQTGFVPQATGFQPQPAMYQPQVQAPMFQPQPTGFQPQQFVPQPTGFQPQQTGFQPSASMLAPQQQFGSGMMPQQTGYPTNQMAQMSIQPTGSPSMFNQPQQQQVPQQMQAPGSSSSATEYQPSNIFAQMKAGQFAKPADQQPQQEQKYDSLRPQPTGFAAGGQMGGMQPLQAQPTGFAPFGGYMQQQPPPMMYGQQTGYPYRQY